MVPGVDLDDSTPAEGWRRPLLIDVKVLVYAHAPIGPGTDPPRAIRNPHAMAAPMKAARSGKLQPGDEEHAAAAEQ